MAAHSHVAVWRRGFITDAEHALLSSLAPQTRALLWAISQPCDGWETTGNLRAVVYQRLGLGLSERGAAARLASLERKGLVRRDRGGSLQRWTHTREGHDLCYYLREEPLSLARFRGQMSERTTSLPELLAAPRIATSV